MDSKPRGLSPSAVPFVPPMAGGASSLGAAAATGLVPRAARATWTAYRNSYPLNGLKKKKTQCLYGTQRACARKRPTSTTTRTISVVITRPFNISEITNVDNELIVDSLDTLCET